MHKYFTLLLILCTACTISINETSFSLLENSTCKLPCWNNIYVGKTKNGELINILNELPSIHQKPIFILNSSSELFDGEVWFQLYPVNGEKGGPRANANMYLKDGLVATMEFCGYLHLSIGDIIEMAGAPNNILIYPGPSAKTRIEVINSQLGIGFWYDATSKSLQTEINPEIEVSCLNIFNPTYYEKMIDAGLFTFTRTTMTESIHPWVGYGNIKELYNP